MCGITGIIAPGAQEKIRKMTDALTHRGPDESGYYSDPVIAIGQRRLSIIDLAGGRQPIANEDESLYLVCNGEIYNSPELRTQLIEKGHSFRTATDVEVILHLYEEHGKECARYLRGMFAFALWDKRDNSLLVARDHLGQKPLFFYHDNDIFIFASEVKAILQSGLVNPEIDLNGLWHYISLRFMPDRYTFFKRIEKLPAATLLTFKDGKATCERYWDLSFRQKNSRSESEIIDELDELLRDTIKMHLLSDVRVGSFLSGGIDSSTVASIMASVTSEPVPVFSIGVKDQSFNELPFARLVADKYGMEAHERIVDADLIRLIPKMIYHMDEPSDPFGVGVYLVSEVASEVVKVVLGGDGGDENFAGYDRFAGQRFVDYYSVVPHWLRKSFIQKIVDRLPESFGYKSFAQKAAWLNDMSFYSGGERYAQSMSFLRFTESAKRQLFTENALDAIDDDDCFAKILAHFNAENAEHLIDKMLFTDLMTRMPDHLLTLVDRMTMAHSLESRSPLIDYKVVEYAASLPADMKLRGKNLKYALKRVAERYLPKELIYRQKQGFSFPIGRWMRTDLKTFMYNLFERSRFVESGIMNGAYIDTIVAEHMSGKVDHNYRLWILINLEIWHRIYLENMDLDSVRAEIDELMIH